MKKIFANENPMVSSLAFSLISVAIFLFIEWAAKVQTGASWYESSLTVEASFALIYKQEHIGWLRWAGLIISLVAQNAYIWKIGGLGAGSGDKTPARMYFIFWGIVILTSLVAWSGSYGSHEYQEIVTPAVFEYLKGNSAAIDSLFIK